MSCFVKWLVSTHVRTLHSANLVGSNLVHGTYAMFATQLLTLDNDVTEAEEAIPREQTVVICQRTDQSSNVSIEFVNLNAEPINEQNERHNFAERLRQRLFSRAIGTGSKDKIARAVVKGKNSGGGVGVDPCPTGGEEHGPGRQSVAPEPSSVLHVPHRATDCIQSWTARLCCAFFDCKSNQTSESTPKLGYGNTHFDLVAFGLVLLTAFSYRFRRHSPYRIS
ncbi:hypothetical protein OUZ56_001640 [Daphnia magna]|uniref:Uncharacterized protein n=1 Tax=Daphnia magna TaxID=35525 RepID=A0ABR0A399_9CRUS|nr:hypothetical protein OUZ56_001640 [Daphnia magna]